MPSLPSFICGPPPLAPHKDYITSNIFVQYTWICNILQCNVIYSLPELFENAMEIKREREREIQWDTHIIYHYLIHITIYLGDLRRNWSCQDPLQRYPQRPLDPAHGALNIQHHTTQIGAQVRECCFLASAYFWDTFQEVYDSFPQQHWMTRISTDI